MPNQPETISHQESMNLALWATAAGAKVATVFIDSGHGTNALGTEAFIAFVAIPVIATFAHSPEMVTFWYVWIGFLAFRKLTANRAESTRYVGWPWAVQLLTLGLLPEWLMRMIEPFFVYVAARMLAPWSPPVAKLLLFSALSLCLQNAVERERARRKRDAIHDARVEGQLYR